jgi:hypothetical protein
MRPNAIIIEANKTPAMHDDMIETMSLPLNLKSYKLMMQHMTKGENWDIRKFRDRFHFRCVLSLSWNFLTLLENYDINEMIMKNNHTKMKRHSSKRDEPAFFRNYFESKPFIEN